LIYFTDESSLAYPPDAGIAATIAAVISVGSRRDGDTIGADKFAC
jgi:hypothetical protein